MASTTDIEAILKTLTLEEKASLLAGVNFWATMPIPEKGVPSVKTTDGPNGTRGADFDGNTKAACFPAASSIAASFDPEIASRVGVALAEEARSKGAKCLLAPTVCIHRHPLGGRNFESYSEDPLLTGRLASQMIQGVQSLGVSATIKHFVANEQETDRMSVDETISQRALREIYLRPFEIAVKEAKPWAIMTAYQLVNGTHCDSHEWLLSTVLRGEWGWKGLVMSDWGGTNSVAGSINAGLDVEMPGPARVRMVPEVMAALKRGDITEEKLTERARTVLEFCEQVNAFRDSEIQNERAVDRPEHRALIRDAGAKGMVLLKNDRQLLPLSKERVQGKKIAMIGFAKDSLMHGGGSASVNPHYRISPWDAMHKALGDSVTFTYAKGYHKERLLPPIAKDGRFGSVVSLDGTPGFTRYFFNSRENTTPESELHGYENSAYNPLGSQESWNKVLEMTGDFTPVETGSHYLACSGFGATQVFVNDKPIFNQEGNCRDPMGALFQAMDEEEFTYPFEAGKTYRLRVRSYPPVNTGMKILEGRTGFRMGFALASEHDADLKSEAEQAARDADIAVVFTGHDPQWETEGRDQDSFNLPCRGSQDAVVSAVAAANPNTIVVNATGVAVAMPWLDQIASLVQTWFPGQESGNAIADVLTGAANPEGHLPVTFPKRVEDAPAHGNFPGEYKDGRLRVTYAEGVFVGYRHFDRLSRDKVNFPFGFGLSYTTFKIGEARLAKASEEQYKVTIPITNTGTTVGGTVVQLYAGRVKALEDHPVKTLVAFKKVRLQPGEEQVVELEVAPREFAYFDEQAYRWAVDAGEYQMSVGRSCTDIEQKLPFSVEAQLVWKP